ncbi:MAG TPA: lipopolysaccharide heptosyltransferase II [Burkholderiales bacterium]|nr:lipopolysaccharide heptosyltransferase II [Burkholderiales bacterium]
MILPASSRTLIVAPNWIGDALLAQPLFARLREQNSALQIDVIAPPWTGPVLARMPEINRVIDAPFAHGEFGLSARWALARQLKAHHYNRAIVLPNSWKSALIPFVAGIPERVGFTGEARYGLLNVRHHLDKEALPLMAERYAKLAEPPQAPPYRPLRASTLRIDENNLATNLSRLGLDRTRPMVAMCPGAEFGPSKRWPVRHFAALAARLASQGVAVWLFGSPKDQAVGDEIVSLSNGACISLCGRTDLYGAMDLLSLARCVVTNDSGLMHMAAALHRPIVALYGSSSAAHTPPLSHRAALLSLNLVCSPCFQRECPLGHHKCLEEMLPVLVKQHVDRLSAA